MQSSSSADNTPDESLRLPRILCLHGGGTNAQIFISQCRGLSLQLRDHFRLVFPTAPHNSQAGPDVLMVYKDCGPFKRWMGWLPEHGVLEPAEGIDAIETSLRSAMDADNEKGASGPWVGLLGFSQGAKVAASLLLRQQMRNDWGPHPNCSSTAEKWRFAVLMAGRGPLVLLDENLEMVQEGDWTLGVHGLRETDQVITLPTIHVHGLQDPGIQFHRRLYYNCCEDGSTRLIEWEGNHRLPFKKQDVEIVVENILDVARQTGAIPLKNSRLR